MNIWNYYEKMIREKVAKEIEKQPCWCEPSTSKFDGDTICWRCNSAAIARGEKEWK